MRLHHVLLVTAATLLASASALLATDEIKGSRLGHLKVTGTYESLKGYSTYKMWKDVGLEKITTREQPKRFRTPKSSSSTSATPLSLTNTSLPCLAVLILGPLVYRPRSYSSGKYARAEIWAEKGRDDTYVMEFWG
ncbi:hypothetical protein GQ600_22710 [Phytophthora cactorum]|nr:hypothetical protein GQ600_22710 [Phytophthora cactorum]